MSSVIIFANLKGGTGKTTLCTNIAAHLATNHRVLIVDFNPQSNTISGLEIESQQLEHSIYDAVLSQYQGYDGVSIS
ncbi:ParA family protein [Leptothoe spongobia]|uniref:AAA family ATPase n=1 Tax=Leptothoe spongobia TAU-MAC 1115 TaxID=1967444 RepID=A0A947GJW6_9CYAN|nr:AAA family ATPase [Leptothoe spongobia]MBT9317365.1 AAA family ATPase [Leptothoe spongobia TAU-MAC 1115]